MVQWWTAHFVNQLWRARFVAVSILNGTIGTTARRERLPEILLENRYPNVHFELNPRLGAGWLPASPTAAALEC